MTIFDELESNVRYYCRHWPAVFTTASGSTLADEAGKTYTDFFSGAGALSYGHNHPLLTEVAVNHLRSGRIMHSLDTHTPEKRALLDALHDRVLVPRELDMVVQFTGPTGATAVEAALRLAEKVTGRSGVIAYEGGYHGMTAGAASVSASLDKRHGSNNRKCQFLPYVTRHDDLAQRHLEAALLAPEAEQLPGALIVEPVQGEAGARPFDPRYLGEVRRLCSKYGVIVIADEVQVGVGRTGPFFSFQDSALEPDIVCLSKSLSGFGLPLAVNLIQRDLDQWAPGEFTGTFRGNNLAFATATAVLQYYWQDEVLEKATICKAQIIEQFLRELATEIGLPQSAVQGRGLIWALNFPNPEIATAIVATAFRLGLIIEACGQGQTRIKLLPSLLIGDGELARGLAALAEAIRLVIKDSPFNVLQRGPVELNS